MITLKLNILLPPCPIDLFGKKKTLCKIDCAAQHDHWNLDCAASHQNANGRLYRRTASWDCAALYQHLVSYLFFLFYMTDAQQNIANIAWHAVVEGVLIRLLFTKNRCFKLLHLKVWRAVAAQIFSLFSWKKCCPLAVRELTWLVMLIVEPSLYPKVSEMCPTVPRTPLCRPWHTHALR